MGQDRCQPWCGPVKRCKMTYSQGNHHRFHCDCSEKECIDVAFTINPQALLSPDDDPASICAMEVAPIDDNDDVDQDQDYDQSG